MLYLIAGVIGYLFGCLHGSKVIGNIKDIDIKNNGVKNAGASNTALLLGWKYGAVVALIDIFKAIFAIMLMMLILKNYFLTLESQMFYLYITGLFTVIGHNYPVNMRFKGGKGTASVIGVFLAIDWKIAVFGFLILLLFSLVTDYLVIGVHFMYLSFLVTSYIFFSAGPAWIVSIMLLLSIWKHLENYKRMVDSTEIRLSSVVKKKLI